MSVDNPQPNQPQPEVFKPGMNGGEPMTHIDPRLVARAELIEESRQFSIETAFASEGMSLDIQFADDTTMHLEPIWKESAEHPGERYRTGYFEVSGLDGVPENSWAKRMDVIDGDVMSLAGAGAGTMVKGGVIAEHTPITFARYANIRDIAPEEQAKFPWPPEFIGQKGELLLSNGHNLLRPSAHQFTADVAECYLVGANGSRRAIFNPVVTQ